jgi:hypothetical protein
MNTDMAAFPSLVEPITVPASKLSREAQLKAGLTPDDYAVIEPASDGVQVRAATVNEQLAYEQSHRLGHVTYSLEEFLAELYGD